MQFLYCYRATQCNPIISPYGFHFNKTLIHIHFHCFCSQKNPPRLSLSLPPMPPKIVTDYAKSDRSLCKKCSKAISKTALRLGSVLKNRGGFDSTHWHHLDCFPFNSEPIDSVESIQGFSSLESGDQEALKKLVVEGKNSAEEVLDGSKEGSQQLKQLMVQVTDEDRDEVGLEERKQKKHKNPPPAQPNTPRIIAEYAKSDRSSCKRCSKIISKKALRLGSVVRDPRGFESTKWHHVDCFPFTSEPIDSAESIQGFLSLESGDQEALKKSMVECKNSMEEVQVTNEGRDEVELEERSLKRSKILIPQNLDMTSLPNNGNASSAASNTASSPFLKRKSNDIGWEFGILADATNPDKVKCKLCGKVFSGGVYRMKEHVGHITGNVSACPLATKEDQVRCKQAITDARNKKKNKKKEEEEIKDEVNIVGEEEEEMEGLGSRKKPNFLGPMDRFASVINPDSSMSTSRTLCQQNISEALFKERKHSVHQYVARWVYEAGIPFNAIDNDSFKSLVKAVGQFGPGFRPPSEYELRETLLNEEVEKTKEALKKHEEEWKLNGCSIIIDAWTDIEGMRIINLCVNCKKGTTFLSSKESSIKAHTSEHIFEYVFKAIEQVGPENVVQVVTDNASNNIAVAKMLKEKMPNVFWTSCATQTINLMLESISKIPKFKKTIDLAKTFTIFIYAHYKTLALMRIFTRKRDIVRWGVTRFATSFLTLQSLVEKKDRLRAMFTSTKWDECKWAKTIKGKTAYSTMMSISFWNEMTLCLKVFAPLVKVLRLVYGNRKPSMGFLYGELKQAKQEIREVLNNNENSYRPIFQIIDEKAKDRLDTPLHLTAYLLNPFYFFKDPSIQDDDIVSDGIFNFVEIFFPNDFDLQNQVVNIELAKYKKKEGAFGKLLASKGCETNDDNYDPVVWWSTYGSQTPNLKRVARRILSLTTSSFGCEKNKSTFDGLSTPSREANLEIVFSISDIKDSYKDAKLLPNWKAFQTIIFLERDDGLHDSKKIAAFDFDGCLVNTSVKRIGADAWSLMYSSVPEKLQRLYNDGYKLVIFTNESNIDRWIKQRQKAVDSKIGRLSNFIKRVKVPIQVFIACGIGNGKAEDPFRKPKLGMWRIMEKHFNSGISIDMDQSFYVGDAAGRNKDHSDADIKFAQAVGLKFFVPEEYFGS